MNPSRSDKCIDLTSPIFHHEKYRYTHDVLHLAYRSDCGESCPIRNHFLLQDKIVAVRFAERRVR
jgi:hypothetical protein